MADTAARLPLIDLHVHLEGSMSPATVEALARANGTLADLPALEWRADGHRWPRPDVWLNVMRQVSRACLRTPDNYAFALAAYLHELADQDAGYCEPSVTLVPENRAAGPAAELLDSLTRTIREVAAVRAIDAGLIVALDYATPTDQALMLVELAGDWRDRGVVGIDLHGAPTRPMADFVPVFERARARGLGTRVHAGEVQGPRSVWNAVDVLGVRRIAHGIRAVEDPALVARLAANRIPLDVCPTANVSLGVVPSWPEHPVRKLFDAGVAITIGTDDPLYFVTTIAREYEGLATHHHFSEDEQRLITQTAAAAAFRPVARPEPVEVPR